MNKTGNQFFCLSLCSFILGKSRPFPAHSHRDHRKIYYTLENCQWTVYSESHFSGWKFLITKSNFDRKKSLLNWLELINVKNKVMVSILSVPLGWRASILCASVFSFYFITVFWPLYLITIYWLLYFIKSSGFCILPQSSRWGSTSVWQ